jgi:hypothetical protein
VPRPTGDHENPEHQEERVGHGRPEGRVGQQVGVVLEAGEAADGRIEQIVVLEREPQGHDQRHDHPQEQDDHRGCDQRQGFDVALAAWSDRIGGAGDRGSCGANHLERSRLERAVGRRKGLPTARLLAYFG